MANNFLKKSDFASAPLAVYSFEPLAYLINKGAEKLWEDHRTAARIVSTAQYLTNPIDRAIQAVITPFFTSASFIYNAHSGYGYQFPDDENNSKLAKACYLGFQAGTFLPAVAAKTVLIWTALAVNTAIHLFPFKIISACEDNRPFNFFAHRDYYRLENHNSPNFLKELFSPIWSDKFCTRWLARNKLLEIEVLRPLVSANCDKEIQTYDVEFASEQFNKELINRSEPDDAFIKNGERHEFLDNLNHHSVRLCQQVGSLPRITVDTCSFLHHLEYYAGLDNPDGFETVFFLPEGLNEAEKIAEVKWRYGFCLKLLGRMKDYNSIVEGSMTKSDVADADWLRRTDPWIQRVEAVLAYTYLQLLPPED